MTNDRLYTVNVETNNNCTLLCVTLSILAFAGGTVCYFIFGIISLIDDYKIANDCKNSNLWEYVLVAMIMSTSNIKMGTTSDASQLAILFIVGIINLGLSIWGGIELWDNSKRCDDVYNSNLWKIGLASFILQVVGGMFCFVFVPLILYYATHESLESSDKKKVKFMEDNDLETPFSNNATTPLES